MAVVLEIGPVGSDAAFLWIENARKVIAAVREHRAELPFAVPPEVIAAFVGYIDEWDRAARLSPVFYWRGEAEAERVRLLLQYWFNIDALDDAMADRFGITWSPAAARPFLDAVVRAVLGGLEAEASTADFARALRRSWRNANDPYASVPASAPAD